MEVAKGTTNVHIKNWYRNNFVPAWEQWKLQNLSPAQRTKARAILMLDHASIHEKAFKRNDTVVQGHWEKDVYISWIGEGATAKIQPVDTSKINLEVPSFFSIFYF